MSTDVEGGTSPLHPILWTQLWSLAKETGADTLEDRHSRGVRVGCIPSGDVPNGARPARKTRPLPLFTQNSSVPVGGSRRTEKLCVLG